MSKFDLFVKQIDFKEPIKLEKIKVNQKLKRWTFVIQFEKVLDPRVLTQFTNQLEVMFRVPPIEQIDYEFKYENESLEQYGLDYYKFIVNKVSAITPSLSIFKSYDPVYHNGIYTLKIENDAQIVAKRAPELKSKFKKYGISNIDFKFEIEHNKSVNQMLEDQIKEQTRVAEMVREKKEVILDEKHKIYNRFQAKPIEISEIPKNQYELDTYINENGVPKPSFLIEGQVFKLEVRDFPKTSLAMLTIADDDDAMRVKYFFRDQKNRDVINMIKAGDIISVQGECVFDTFDKDIVIMARSINTVERKSKNVRIDKAKEKRVEFHVHTNMSNLDGITSAESYINRLEKWGHKAVGFVDHQGVNAFPEIVKAVKGKKIKPIYGAEFEYVDTKKYKITNNIDIDFELMNQTYVVFDIETTGLSVDHHKIIEISGHKIRNNMVIDTFQSFININEPLSEFIKEFTGITDENIASARDIKSVLSDFVKFIKDSCLVAHNGFFDYDFIMHNAKINDIELDEMPLIDTLSLVKVLNPEMKRINLKALARQYKIKLENHHRAEEDAKVLAEAFMIMLKELFNKDITKFKQLNLSLDYNETWKYAFTNHITIITQTKEGLKNLYKLVSDAMTDHFHDYARVTDETLKKYRKGLLIGSSCVNGAVFETALNKNRELLVKEMEMFDYIEVQPPSVYQHLYETIGENGKEVIQATIKKIIDVAKENKKIVIASGDTHYLDPSDKKYREVFIKGKGLGGGRHPLFRANLTPDQHLYTTDEMLEEFSFLDSDLSYEIVIKNTNKLNDKIEYIELFPKELFSIEDDAFNDTLGVASAEKEIVRLVWEKAKTMYGEEVHPIVKDRINKELDSIIKNKFATIYYISYLLVQKSLSDGYLVGSRGSVGSSLVATLLDVTEVNPLKPHYYCPNNDFQTFKMSEDEIFKYGIKEDEKPFMELTNHVSSGFDLKDAKCPHCGSNLRKEGHDIPFETFLGFKGDKVPDIDLNFSGDYQAIAHNYVRELLGEDYTFRAGTIQTIKDRNALGYAKGFYEDHGIDVRWAQVETLSSGLIGVKRSTGQHPGGIVVVPKSKSIFDVTPIQYPADLITSDWKTTHFDYHSFEDNLLKLDILGHDDPTMVKYLMDYVKKKPEDFPFSDAKNIPLDDPKVYQLFTNPNVIDINPDDIYGNVASFGIPEFGTGFTRQILRDTKPTTFAGLVRISGLSHGTDVWLKNSQDLVLGNTQFGKIPFDKIIGCRDDIMVDLTNYGMPDEKAFEIMEFVRKGLPSKNIEQWKQYEFEMKNFGVDPWYIWSSAQIKYMFPKAHATAYVIMAMRIAWFKVYSPLLFYSAFFSKRAVQFDYEVMVAGTNAIRNKILSIMKSNTRLTAKEEDLLTTLHVAYEMCRRGFKFYPINIEESKGTTFVIKDDGLIMAFNTIDGLGEQASTNIEEARLEKSFESREDLRERGKVNKSVFDRLDQYGALDHLQEKKVVEQFDLFSKIN